MAITKAAQKSLRQSLRRHKQNLVAKDTMKETLKEFRNLVIQKKTKEAQELLAKVYKALDKSAKVSIIKKNKANRLKSRLTILLNKNSK
jgi:ribosomal protein S20